MGHSTRHGINRRTLVKGGAAAIAAPALLGPGAARGQARVIKIGHVSPRTGPLAGFGEADNFIIDQVRGILKKGLQIGGRNYQVQIVSKDSQSTGSRAAEVASELILSDKVDLLIAAGTPDTTNPVSDQAEVNEVPCVCHQLPVAAVLLRPQGRSRQGLQLDLPVLLGPRRRDRGVPRAVGRRADQQGRRRPVPERRRRQRLGRPEARPAAGARRAPATSCSIPAAIR